MSIASAIATNKYNWNIRNEILMNGMHICTCTYQDRYRSKLMNSNWLSWVIWDPIVYNIRIQCHRCLLWSWSRYRYRSNSYTSISIQIQMEQQIPFQYILIIVLQLIISISIASSICQFQPNVFQTTNGSHITTLTFRILREAFTSNIKIKRKSAHWLHMHAHVYALDWKVYSRSTKIILCITCILVDIIFRALLWC
jgi:hypothetical protein